MLQYTSSRIGLHIQYKNLEKKGASELPFREDQERIVNANTKILRIWAEIRVMLLDPDGMIIRTKKAQKK